MAAIEPTDEQLQEKIRELVPKIDLHSTGMKQFCAMVAKEMGLVDLKSRKDFIKKALTDAINEQASSDEEEGAEGEDENESDGNSDNDEEEVATPKKKKRGGGGFGGSKPISEKLANFLGQGNEMARTEIVKALWDYIRKHNLQNPENKKEIILDSKMKQVFGCDTFTMFSMNK